MLSINEIIKQNTNTTTMPEAAPKDAPKNLFIKPKKVRLISFVIITASIFSPTAKIIKDKRMEIGSINPTYLVEISLDNSEATGEEIK